MPRPDSGNGEPGGGVGEVSADVARQVRAIVSSGLFDAAFYRAQLDSTGAPGPAEAPVLHYVREGWRAGLDPHPLFDVSWYLAEYPDVAAAGLEPLQHYLASGWREGRDPSAGFSTNGYLAARPRLAAEGVCPLVHFAAASMPSSDTQAAARVRGRCGVAVTLHVFYPDFVEVFARALAALPRPADVFVTVPDASVRSAVEARLAGLRQAAALDVRVVPNRGRNFGPLLVEFAPVLQDYAVMGHFHSKKSLYTGAEQSGWVGHILGTLLRDPGRVERILAALGSGSGGPYGIAYAVTPPGLPYWANHWLGNYRHAAALTPPGLPAPADGFVAYPVGGMFWARVDALRPLLGMPWSYEMFPVESGQADGTVHHALERMVAHVVAAMGRRSLILEPGSDRSWEPLQDVLEVYSRTRPEVIAPLVRQGRGLVSFDLFETLVQRRTGYPDWGKLSLGRRLATTGAVGSPAEFARLRDQAEAELAAEAGGRWDATLDQIHRRLAQRLPLTVDPGSLAELEFADDADCLEPRERIPGWARERIARGLPTAVVTDTYYERERVEAMLSAAGIDPAGCWVLCSSQEGARKDRGDMWDRVLDLAARHADGTLLHVGDNVRSDVQAVVDAGHRSLHVASPADRWFVTTGDRWLAPRDLTPEAEWTGRLVAAQGRDPFVSGLSRG